MLEIEKLTKEPTQQKLKIGILTKCRLLPFRNAFIQILYLVQSLFAAVMFVGSLLFSTNEAYSIMVIIISVTVLIFGVGVACKIWVKSTEPLNGFLVFLYFVCWWVLWLPLLFAFMFFYSGLIGHKIG
tara:strand:- start:736 stop:1119 length:384 start_codon:yes stop_codon:yes gene_type:complete